MRSNRFVFLNRPMLSLETHLGVTASPQVPFPADFVTLPVPASHRRFGSLPLTAEKGQARYCNFIERCIPDMLKQRRPHAGRLGWLGVLQGISLCRHRTGAGACYPDARCRALAGGSLGTISIAAGNYGSAPGRGPGRPDAMASGNLASRQTGAAAGRGHTCCHGMGTFGFLRLELPGYGM